MFRKLLQLSNEFMYLAIKPQTPKKTHIFLKVLEFNQSFTVSNNFIQQLIKYNYNFNVCFYRILVNYF